MDNVKNFNNSSDQPNEGHISWKIWIARKIKAVREEKEYCIGMLSVLSSLSEEHIHRIENAEISPSDAALTKISMALSVPREIFDPPKDI